MLIAFVKINSGRDEIVVNYGDTITVNYAITAITVTVYSIPDLNTVQVQEHTRK